MGDVAAGRGVALSVRETIDELASMTALLVAQLPGAREAGPRRRYVNQLADRIEAETVDIVRAMG